MYNKSMISLNHFASRLIPFFCILTTLLFTPFINRDPVNPVRMIAITTLGSVLFGLILISFKLFKGLYKTEIIILLLLILDLILVFFLSGANKVEQLYGTIGRNYGLLTQISLALICIGSLIFSSRELLAYFTKILILTSFINMSYGLVQVMGLDFVKNMSAFQGTAVGFFAQPNQFSSFTAVAALVSVSNMTKKNRGASAQLGSIFFILFSFFNLFLSNSTQGFIILLAGILLIFSIYLKFNSSKKIYFQTFLLGSFITLTATILDIFQKVPWDPIIYSNTVTYRGDFWRAGIAMGLERPWFGVGLDKYLEWYRVSRDDTAANRPGGVANELADSAHNIFIDYFATGGFPLLLIFMFIIFLALLKIIDIVRKSSNYDSDLSGLSIVFIGYLLQSIISPSSLGFSIWGWVAIGIILGIKIDVFSTIESKNKMNPKQKPVIDSKLLTTRLLIMLCSVTGLIGIFISAPFLVQDMKIRTALKPNLITPDGVSKSAYIWPMYGTRMAEASWLLYKNGFSSESLKIGKDAIKYSPNNYYTWLVLYSRTDLDPILKAQVEKNIKRLEPREKNIINAGQR